MSGRFLVKKEKSKNKPKTKKTLVFAKAKKRRTWLDLGECGYRIAEPSE